MNVNQDNAASVRIQENLNKLAEELKAQDAALKAQLQRELHKPK